MASDGATNLSRTFKYLFATQFLSRGIPFIFNSWIIRHVTAKDNSLYAVQFHLFVTCVFFLSREGFWRACMRADIKCDGASTGENASKILKVAWMTVPFGIVITVAACVFWWQELSYSNPYAQAILINVAMYLVNRLDMPKKKLVRRSPEDARKSWKLGSCLTDALKLALLIGLVVMAFGPSYSYSLIRLLYGQKWSDGEASTALQYYCLYVITLAMNGTSEAFLHAVATENQIKRSNDPLLVFSLIYIIMNVVLIRSAGAVGLIVANSSSTLLPWVDNNWSILALLSINLVYFSLLGLSSALSFIVFAS
ncbi:protein RFT1 homolog [Camellia sinensis]|uniref:protein RFT1 homolog n=1 Tax=Camellia sinensis TaxID=4442 RepID=UPI0010364C25|nr:protein RFT1 homolog [Camellia sinensis]